MNLISKMIKHLHVSALLFFLPPNFALAGFETAELNERSRKPMSFQLKRAQKEGIEHKVYQVEYKKPFYDYQRGFHIQYEVIFPNLTQKQFDYLLKTYHGEKETVFQAGRQYALQDFLPRTIQALVGKQYTEDGESKNECYQNCWSTAYGVARNDHMAWPVFVSDNKETILIFEGQNFKQVTGSIKFSERAKSYSKLEPLDLLFIPKEGEEYEGLISHMAVFIDDDFYFEQIGTGQPYRFTTSKEMLARIYPSHMVKFFRFDPKGKLPHPSEKSLKSTLVKEFNFAVDALGRFNLDAGSPPPKEACCATELIQDKNSASQLTAAQAHLPAKTEAISPKKVSASSPKSTVALGDKSVEIVKGQNRFYFAGNGVSLMKEVISDYLAEDISIGLPSVEEESSEFLEGGPGFKSTYKNFWFNDLYKAASVRFNSILENHAQNQYIKNFADNYCKEKGFKDSTAFQLEKQKALIYKEDGGYLVMGAESLKSIKLYFQNVYCK